jgi:hypothetical protein
MYPDSSKDTEALDSVDTVNKGQSELADEALKRGVYIVANVNKFITPRLEQIAKYRDLYAGRVPRKFRQPFSVVLPVFAGMMDTLHARKRALWVTFLARRVHYTEIYEIKDHFGSARMGARALNKKLSPQQSKHMLAAQPRCAGRSLADMDGKLFVKYASRPSTAEAARRTERGGLMDYFCKRINAGRAGTRFAPVSMARMGRILQAIPTKDLYYLKRICDDAKHFSKRFWWELDAQKHPSPTDLRSLSDSRPDRPTAVPIPFSSTNGPARPIPAEAPRKASLWPVGNHGNGQMH